MPAKVEERALRKSPDSGTALHPESGLLPEELVTLFSADDGHLYLAFGDGRRGTRLTWSPEDFETVHGVLPMPGVTGDLEDGNFFSHPTPSPDGKLVAAFGLLPTLDEDVWDFEGSPWEAVEGDFPYLESAWSEEDEEEEGDDVAGAGMVIALVEDEEGGEAVLVDLDSELEELDPEERAEAEEALMAEMGLEDEDAELEEDDDLPGFWPGGRVYVIHLDGVRVWEPFELETGNPTHLDWAPDGRHLLVLHRQEDQLHLDVVDGLEPGAPARLLSGEPVFWSWQPGGARLALRAGTAEGAIVALADPLTDPEGGCREVAPAGSFYVPAWHPDGGSLVVGVPGSSRENDLVHLDADGHRKRRLMSYPGRAAFQWSTSGDRLALAISSEGHGAFEALEILDLGKGTCLTRHEGSFIAFQWLPGGGILLCDADPDSGLLCWSVLDPDGSVRCVGLPFMPTRECVVSLHFFEQVAASHPFVSPDGRYVVCSGIPVGDVDGAGVFGPLDGRGEPPQLLVTPLFGDEAPPVSVGVGRFGCFSRR